jgi:hypothetical protein
MSGGETGGEAGGKAGRTLETLHFQMSGGETGGEASGEASGALETLHFPAELPDEETCEITRAFSTLPNHRACSLPDESLPEQQRSDLSRASSSSSWAVSTADFRSKIRFLRQQRHICSMKGKAQAFQDA